jgi:hypothetical protein
MLVPRFLPMIRNLIGVICLGLVVSCAQRAADSASVCRTDGQRRMCIGDAKTCPCEAYGDCEMPGCLAMGEQVAAERETAARTPAPVPDVFTPESEPTPEIRTEIPSSTNGASATIQTDTREVCRSSSDDRQCREESYYCPCEAYGDCGHAYCVEPAVKPTERIQICRTDDHRELCRRDSALCPCPVDGECGMPECRRAPEAATPASPESSPSLGTSSIPSGGARHCSTNQDRATCQADPYGCPCEAYGDCGMANCR